MSKLCSHSRHKRGDGREEKKVTIKKLERQANNRKSASENLVSYYDQIKYWEDRVKRLNHVDSIPRDLKW